MTNTKYHKNRKESKNKKHNESKPKMYPKRYWIYFGVAYLVLGICLYLFKFNSHDIELLIGIILFIIAISIAYLYLARRYNFFLNPNLSNLCLYIPNIIVILTMIAYVIHRIGLIYLFSYHLWTIVQILRILNDMAPLGVLWVGGLSFYHNHIKKHLHKKLIRYLAIIAIFIVSAGIYMPSVLAMHIH